MKRMLFLLDFSRASHEALKYYLDLAGELEFEVSVINLHEQWMNLQQEQRPTRDWLGKWSVPWSGKKMTAALLQHLVKLSREYDAIMLGDPHYMKEEEEGSVLNIRLIRKLMGKAWCPVWLIPYQFRFRPLRNILLPEKDLELYRHGLLGQLRRVWGTRIHIFQARRRVGSVAAYQRNRFDEGKSAGKGGSAPIEWLAFANRHEVDLCVQSVGNGSILEDAVQTNFFHDRLHYPLLVFNRHAIRLLREAGIEESTGYSPDGLLLAG